MTKEEMLRALLEYEEKNDYFNLTTADRREFQMWVERLLDRDYEKAIKDIKTEIKEEKEYAYADFERYKVDYLGQDWEDVLDSLPQDDYRYGMERCLDIIDKRIGGE